MSTQQRWLNLDGKRIDCALFLPDTPQANPPAPSAWSESKIILLHEGLGCIALWREFPQQLANALSEPVLTYSRYGYGQSQVLCDVRNPRFMHDEADTPLCELFAQLGLRDVILIGHSDGASIALLHAALHPQLIRAVVVMAPHLFVEPFGLESIAKARAQFESGDLAAKLGRYHLDPAATFNGWCNVWLSAEFFVWNITAEVAQIHCPVLAIQGEGDQYGSMRQIETIAQVHQHTRLLKLADCRHSPHLEHPAQTLAAIVEFIGEQRAFSGARSAP